MRLSCIYDDVGHLKIEKTDTVKIVKINPNQDNKLIQFAQVSPTNFT